MELRKIFPWRLCLSCLLEKFVVSDSQNFVVQNGLVYLLLESKKYEIVEEIFFFIFRLDA